MEKENIIELLEDFIDFLKDKEGEEKQVVIVDDTNNDEDFDNAIDKIAKGE